MTGVKNLSPETKQAMLEFFIKRGILQRALERRKSEEQEKKNQNQNQNQSNEEA